MGGVGRIRKALDGDGFQDACILSYAVKYASSFYGPFREAADCAPKFGDRAGYQMDPGNVREAMREASLDEIEGADMLIVKPALPYLDVLRSVREKTNLPLAAYNVSGEYAMLHAAAAAGMIDLNRAVLEVLTSIRRAGADVILTYHALHAAEPLGGGATRGRCVRGDRRRRAGGGCGGDGDHRTGMPDAFVRSGQRRRLHQRRPGRSRHV